MNNTKEYVNAMNQMNKKLNEEDSLYFNNLREYMQTKIFLRDEDSINIQIYQMYLDFMNAREDGFTAKEFFGNNPKEMADQILMELPIVSPSSISKYIGILALVLWGLRLMFNFSENLYISINPLVYLFDLALIIGLVIILNRIISKNVYREPRISDMNKLDILIVILLILSAFFLYFSIPPLIPSTFEVNIPFPWDIGLTIIYLIIATVVMRKIKFKDFRYTLLIILGLIYAGSEMRIVTLTSLTIPLWIHYFVRFVFILILFLIIKHNRQTRK